MSNLPRVTVVMPNHNDSKWINKAIDSVLNQTYENVGLSIVDDGSDDKSWDLLMKRFVKGRDVEKKGNVYRTYIGKDNPKPITLCRNNTAKGPSEARNIGIYNSWEDTDVYSFLDSDDIYYSNKVKASMEMMLSSPNDIAVVYSDYDTMHQNEGYMIREYKPSFDKFRFLRENIVSCTSLANKRIMYEVAEPTGFFDARLRTCEDYDLWMRMSEKGMIVHIAIALWMYRITDNNSVSQVQQNQWISDINFMRHKLRERQNAR